MALNKRQQRIRRFNLRVASPCFIVLYSSKKGYLDYVAKLQQRGIKVTAKNIKSPHEGFQQFTHDGKNN